MVYFEAWKKYAVFDGRANRTEFFMFCLGNILVALVLVLVVVVGGSILSKPIRMVVVGIYILFILSSIVPGLAVTVRRLHDTGRSGWWYFIGFVPFIGGIILFVFMCLRGNDGVNAYGGGSGVQAAAEPVAIAPNVVSNGADIGLVNFIKQSRSTGKTDDEIHQVLAGSGWAEADIQLGMEAVSQG